MHCNNFTATIELRQVYCNNSIATNAMLNCSGIIAVQWLYYTYCTSIAICCTNQGKNACQSTPTSQDILSTNFNHRNMFQKMRVDLDMEDSGLEVNSSWFARGGCRANEAFSAPPSSPPSSRRTPYVRSTSSTAPLPNSAILASMYRLTWRHHLGNTKVLVSPKLL